MHQTRAETSRKIPIPRKGTKYIARAIGSLENSVPVILTVRDMLKLARTTKEVKSMIHQKQLKINGREVKDYREGIYLFNILHADKDYVLSLLPTGRFFLEEAKNANERACKVIGKKILKGRKLQLNLHDGSNLITDKKISIHDSIYLDFNGKILRHIRVEEGRPIFITSGKYVGMNGKIENIHNNSLTVKIDNTDEQSSLNKKEVFVL